MRWLLLAIALVVGAAQSLEPNPKQEGKQVNKGKAGTLSNPVFVKILPSKSDEKKAEKERHHKDNDARIATATENLAEETNRLVLVTIVLAAFTAFLFGATVVLARDARRTSERQAGEMRDSLAISKHAANAAEKAATLSEQALHLLERADIQLEGISVSPKDTHPGPNTKVTLIFKNFGRSKASKCKAIISMGVDGAQEKIAPAIAPFEMGANATTHHPFSPFKEFITEATFQDVVAGKVALRFKSTLSYDDVFGKHYVLKNKGTYIYPASFSGDEIESYEADENGEKKSK